MRRAFIAVVVLGMTVALALAIGTATATAYPGQAAVQGAMDQSNSADANALAGNGNLTGQAIDQSQSGSGTQVAGQDNSSAQSADAGAIAVQDKPSNTAVGIRVLSPGNDGNVHQSNSADANALAGNINLTGQNIDQAQGGTAAPLTAPCGCQSGSGTQVAGQSNQNWQDAGALAVAAQDKPSNTAVGIRVLSPGEDGNVSQSNSADANALAGNGNLTGQAIDQSQSGSGTQVAGQDNSSAQSADAGAIAVQDKPSNTAVGIRVLSPGNDGNVHQSNSADANALAGNINLTGQNIDQAQGGTAAPLTAPCGCQSGSGTQVAGQSNQNWQDAGALAVAAQDKPSNTAVGIRVLSPGEDGNVSQSNSADANALAGNGNLTGQAIDQSQSGSGTQVAGQDNSSAQSADAGAIAVQDKPSNTAVGIRVLSPGNDGNVHQSNSADANALAGNINLTGQNIDQAQGGTAAPCRTVRRPVRIWPQVAGQSNRERQGAVVLGLAAQLHPSNTATSTDVGGGYGCGCEPTRKAPATASGNVHQSNSADANALAGNINLTGQNIDQAAGGDSRCGCGGSPIQVAGQSNSSRQGAFVLGLAAQLHPSNTATSTDVGGGYGCGCEPTRKAPATASGNVHQSNSVDANALALNLNATRQSIDQTAGGGAIQVAGQRAENLQGAAALAAALQFGAANRAI